MASRPGASSGTGWLSTTPDGPIPRLIGRRQTAHIGQAWKSDKQHETETRYTLQTLRNCPKRWDHFMQLIFNACIDTAYAQINAPAT